MLTYVSGIRINVSAYLYTYIGHSLNVDILLLLLRMAQNINCEHDAMLGNRNINESQYIYKK